MVVRECGLLFRGYTLLNKSYHETRGDKIDKDLRSGLMTALLNFAENAFSKNLVEYFEMRKFVIAFTETKIKAFDSFEPEVLIVYAILDKEKKIDKHISKVIIPSIKKIADHFITKYDGKNLSEVSQFEVFKKTLDKIFGSDTQTLDQKLEGTFF